MGRFGTNELRSGMTVLDGDGTTLGTLKKVLTRGEVLRLPNVRQADVPSDDDFPYLEIAAKKPTTLLYSGYWVPNRDVVAVRDGSIQLASSRADMDAVHWDDKPGFLA
jgi:hypothetical protein